MGWYLRRKRRVAAGGAALKTARANDPGVLHPCAPCRMGISKIVAPHFRQRLTKCPPFLLILDYLCVIIIKD